MKKLFTLLTLAVMSAAFTAYAQTWTVTYPIGGSAPTVEDVQIKCTDVAYRFLAEDATATLYDASGNAVKTLVRDDINLSFKGSYCLVDFEFTPPIINAGEYTIGVPEGIFIANDQSVNPAFSVSFSVTGTEYEVVEATWSCLSPTNGKASSIEQITLSSNYTWDVVTASASGALYDTNFQEVATLTPDNFATNEGNIKVTLPQAVTTVGSYMLVVNDNSFVSTTAGVTNAMFTVELEVEAQEPQPQYYVTTMPEDYSIVNEAEGGIEAIYVTVQGYTYDCPNDEGIKVSILKDGEEWAQVDGSALSKTLDRMSACIILPEDAIMNQAGEYTVYIPSGYFLMTKGGRTQYASPEITLHYTITAATTEPLTWTISPEPGIVDKIDVVTITFNKPVKRALTPYVYLFYTDWSYMPESMTEGVISVSDDGLTATIKFNPVLEYGGIFQLRLYEGSEHLSVEDGEPFPGIRATYKVAAPLYTECTPASGSTVESLQETKLTLRYNTNIAATDEFSAWYVCGEERVKANLTTLKPYDFGDLAYIVVSADEPITTSGTWTLELGEGSLELSNYDETMPSPATSVSFTVFNSSLLSDIAVESENGDVYTLQGVLLKKAATPEEISGLAPGVYIIGGKKTFVK